VDLIFTSLSTLGIPLLRLLFREVVVANSENEMENMNTLHGQYALISNVKVRFKFSYHSFSKRLKTVFIEQQYVHFMCVKFESGI